MKIHTYYKLIPALGQKGQEAILRMWSENWDRAGFQPIVLGQQDAEKHPDFGIYSDHVRSMPAMNHHTPEYEHACFFRWIAMAHVGGGLMADYDCFNAGFGPEDVVWKEMTIYEPPHVPCLVSGSSMEYERVINDIFMKFNLSMYQDWLKPHSRNGKGVSDMLILANHSDQLNGVDLVRQYKKDGMAGAKAIHFSNSSCGGNKVKVIKSWLKTQSTSLWPMAAPSKHSTGTCRSGNGTDCQ